MLPRESGENIPKQVPPKTPQETKREELIKRLPPKTQEAIRQREQQQQQAQQTEEAKPITLTQIEQNVIKSGSPQGGRLGQALVEQRVGGKITVQRTMPPPERPPHGGVTYPYTQQELAEIKQKGEYASMSPISRGARLASVSYLSMYRPESWWAVLSGGGGVKSAGQFAVSTFKWEASLPQDKMQRWATMQFPAYEEVIIPLATGGAFKAINMASKGAGAASTFSKAVKVWTYSTAGVTSGVIGADIGYTAAVSPKALPPKILGLGTQIGLMGVGATTKWTSVKPVESPFYYVKTPESMLGKTRQVSIDDILPNRKYLIDAKQAEYSSHDYLIKQIKSDKLLYTRNQDFFNKTGLEGTKGIYSEAKGDRGELIGIEEYIPETKLGAFIKSKGKMATRPDQTFKMPTVDEVLRHELVHKSRYNLAGFTAEEYIKNPRMEETIVQNIAGRTRMFSESGQPLSKRFSSISDMSLLKNPIELERIPRYSKMIKTSSAEPIGREGFKPEIYKNVVPPPRTIQYSMNINTGTLDKPIFEKQLSFRNIEDIDITANRFRYIKGVQSKLPPTETWTNITIENGKVKINEIPKKSVKLFADTRAEQSLMFLKERQRTPLSYESEIFTKMAKPKETSFTSFGYIHMPTFEPMTYQGTIDLQGMRFGSLQKQVQTQEQQKLLKKTNIQDTMEEQVQRQRSVQRQMQSQMQETRLAQLQIPELKTRIETRFSTETSTKKLFDIPGLSTETIQKQKENIQGYDVYVKERSYVHGKKRYPERWKKANIQPLAQEAALSLGATATDESAAASFKIKKATSEAHKLDIPVNPWGNLQGKFYQKNGVYIEKTSGRIDTSGEIRGISALGWIAERRKATIPTYMPRQPRQVKASVMPSKMVSYKPFDFNSLMKGWGL